MLSFLPCFPTLCCSAISTSSYTLIFYCMFTSLLFRYPGAAWKNQQIAIWSVTEPCLIHVSIGCQVTILCTHLQITNRCPKQSHSYRNVLRASHEEQAKTTFIPACTACAVTFHYTFFRFVCTSVPLCPSRSMFIDCLCSECLMYFAQSLQHTNLESWIQGGHNQFFCSWVFNKYTV